MAANVRKWELTFAALPLKEGGTYTVPFWQYDKGFGTFSARVVGTEYVDTPSGKIAACIVEAGDDPAQLARYKIAKATRQELGYAAGQVVSAWAGSADDQQPFAIQTSRSGPFSGWRRWQELH